MAEIKYEDAVKRLEEIVKQLESGSCPLEDSIKLFEEGAALVKTCEKLLSEDPRRRQGGRLWRL